MYSLFSASSGLVFSGSEKRVAGERTSMRDRSEANLLLWSVRASISVKNFANKVNKLEEWLLAPPVYSLRGTHAYGELPFAEPSRAEQTRDGCNIYGYVFQPLLPGHPLGRSNTSKQANNCNTSYVIRLRSQSLVLQMYVNKIKKKNK
jgi:hypothetical protein